MALLTVASSVSSGLAAYPTVLFDKVAVSTLQSNLAQYNGIEKKIMPDRAGVVLQMFDHSKMSANTTAVTEGTPVAGQSVTQNTRQITLSEFADHISISSKVDRTQLIDQGEANAKLLGYRGALSVDTLITNTVETARAADSATTIDLGSGVYLSAAKVRQAAFSLGAVDVKPKDASGSYFGITHNLTAFDLCNDSSAGSFMDLQKYTSNQANIGPKSNRLGVISGVEMVTSNAVKTHADYPSSGITGYSTSIFGQDAIFGASLGKTALGQDNFGVAMKDFRDGNSLDPAGLIASAVVYHFFFGSAKRPGSTNGFRVIRSAASIS